MSPLPRPRLRRALRVGEGLILAVGLAVQPARPAPAALPASVRRHLARLTPLFDGRTLAGWIQDPPYPVAFSGSDVTDLPALVRRLTGPPDALTEMVGLRRDPAASAALAEFAAHGPQSAGPRSPLRKALVKLLNRLVKGPVLDRAGRFQGVALRQETAALLRGNPSGQARWRLNRMLLEDAFPKELARSPDASWIVRDGAIASTGGGRGVLYTRGDYSRYRLVFQIRHLSGQPDHQPCVLVFCRRPPEGSPGLDALGGIQVQAPNGGHWDYRPGHNNAGKRYFWNPIKTHCDNHAWSEVELLVDAARGTIRMAVAQPVGTRAVENLVFRDPSAGRPGPIALQMHNAGLFDEYRDIRIEIDPREDRLITTE
jgi:3-keto-disaccharide hydrolase